MLTKTANVFNYLGTRAKLGFTPKAAIRLPPECSPAYNLSRILARRRDPGCASPLQKSCPQVIHGLKRPRNYQKMRMIPGYLASAKGTPQPRESEARPAAAWVQVPRIGICGAGCCLSRVTCHICSTSSLRRFHKRHSSFARPGYPGKSHGDRADLGFQYLRSCGPTLRLLPGKPHITPRYPRLVRRWLFHPGGLRASSSHNPCLGVPNIATSQGCRAVTEQGTYRLTQKMERQGQK